jgi:class 3 adenylate cyclase/tetratricopeptide (TPR) repeat protein
MVTALFCDVTGSTALGEELDPEVFRGVMNRYFVEIRATIERHGGTVAKFIGDAVMAVFGIPRLEEDDALRAVRAAAEIRDRLPAVAEEVGVMLRFRTGVNTGPVLVGEGENLAIGDAVNVAARLEQAAAPGDILLGSATLRLVRDAVEVESLEPLSLKGKSERVAAFRLLRVDPSVAGVARHLDLPLVGRRRELNLLRDAWERTVSESGCHLFTLLGPAGVGKSRLAAELFAAVSGRATVLRGRCLHYGEGITFWPIVEAMMALGSPAVGVLERLDAGAAATPEELFWEVRRLLESLAAERPVILHVDDLQWGEQMLVDLLDHVVDLSRGAAILVLCTARLELLEDRPGWGAGKLNATAMLLQPLGAAEAGVMLDHLAADGIGTDARLRIIAASEGNPLFLEEMVALARDRGSVEVPPTIHALLAARLERLAVEERELLQRGAVEGEVFHRMAVRALAGETLAGAIDSRLATLVRKELIRPHPATLGGDDAFRFRHLLIRDAAYDELPMAVRAELHERFATWLEEHGRALLELHEIVGWHLEQSIHYTRRLGRPPDVELSRRAVRHLHRAGVRAYQRSDTTASRNLLERALELGGKEDPSHATICLDLAEQLVNVGEFLRADELLAIAERDPATAELAALPRLEWLVYARPRDAVAAFESELPNLLERLSRAGDDRGLAKAYIAAWQVHWLASRATPAANAARLAAEHARKAGDHGLHARALSLELPPLVRGSVPVPEAARRVDLIEQQEPSPYLAARVALARAWLAQLDGRFQEGCEFAARAITGHEVLGMTLMAAGSRQSLAEIEISRGNLAAARDQLLEADAVAATIGERGHRSTLQAILADVEARLGDATAARAAIDLSDDLSASEDVINYAITHAVRGRLALAEGDTDAAERWARSAVHHAFLTDFPDTQGTAKLELARVLSSSCRYDEAKAEARDALHLFTAKGDRPASDEARALLDQLDHRR